MKLDLAKVNAEFVQFDCRASLPEAVISQFQVLSPPDEEGDFVFEDAYRSSRQYHHAFAVASRRDKEGAVRIHFLYHTVERRVHPSTGRSPIEGLLDCLSKIEATFEFNCSMHFELRKGVEKPVIALPIKLFDGDLFPFTEIQGLRLTKLSDGKQMYSVILDQPSGSSPGVTVQFKFTDRFSTQLPGALLRQGRTIFDRFVTK